MTRGNIIHILDDFLILEKSHEACAASLQRFLHFCADIWRPHGPREKRKFMPEIVLKRAGLDELKQV